MSRDISHLPLIPASQLLDRGNLETGEGPPGDFWNIRYLAGGITELVGLQGLLTLSSELIRVVQQEQQLAAWISAHEDSFYPPDFADNGIDLASLPVVFARSNRQAFRSAEVLLRSGAYRLVVIDMAAVSADSGRTGTAGAGPEDAVTKVSNAGPGEVTAGREGARVPAAYQGRVLRLARQFDSAVICLRPEARGAGPLGSLVSLRLEVSCHTKDHSRGEVGRHFELQAHARKDKRNGPGWTHGQFCRSLAGLY